ncbi:hypothetical protein FVE85_4115 [Porphyridium purpureum]|uniref:Uncharacterized protein n=1 Tax=Porphyridium purpureum TaxID=35688 RepID=A0A5J4YT97_PORPP|nr:hypothetical protein FVE85_4115 [Porphyridium purpureum]|eukprot:POR2189..scf229_5
MEPSNIQKLAIAINLHSSDPGARGEFANTFMEMTVHTAPAIIKGLLRPRRPPQHEAESLQSPTTGWTQMPINGAASHIRGMSASRIPTERSSGVACPICVAQTSCTAAYASIGSTLRTGIIPFYAPRSCARRVAPSNLASWRLRFVDNGFVLTACGFWMTVYGLWLTAHGLWLMVLDE